MSGTRLLEIGVGILGMVISLGLSMVIKSDPHGFIDPRNFVLLSILILLFPYAFMLGITNAEKEEKTETLESKDVMGSYSLQKKTSGVYVSQMISVAFGVAFTGVVWGIFFLK